MAVPTAVATLVANFSPMNPETKLQVAELVRVAMRGVEKEKSWISYNCAAVSIGKNIRLGSFGSDKNPNFA